MLGPVAGPLGRSGYGGRNWEGFSPDPYLTGLLFEEVRRPKSDAVLSEAILTLDRPSLVLRSLVYRHA